MKTNNILKTLIFIIFMSTNSIYAQEKITPVLLERIEAKNENYQHDILILLQDRVDFANLIAQFKQDNATSQERAKRTIYALQNKANETQDIIIDYMQEMQSRYPGKVRNIEQYWITNAICATVSTDIIYDLDKFQEIETIDLDERRFIGPQIMPAANASSKTVNGVEPGIRAINAPAMWNLGYTGKNRIALGYDTGVNFLHPAIADRFLGNFMPLSNVYHTMYDFQYPVDISPSSHGTHTLGTVLGLDKQNNDTIGVAYNAYWMATDPIVSNEANIRPFHVYMEVFEWILNPDGDTATVSDIPDAVNNSWGIGPDHAYYECDPASSLILDAVDAAGIANVFSAGNEGPDAGTIGMPANTARSEVNVFSVGAVNGNSSAFTIAGFSSRGPTPCYDGDNASIKIKPEVVAPGENVRSAQGQNTYGSLSGTSMASPHVTGAVLLLKEAFPTLPGSEILYALYQSANDLGDPGEDNTYGNGIIDVYAAYEYLAETNTPSPPVSNAYDIGITAIEVPVDDFTANETVVPEITIQNFGENEVDLLYVHYTINNEPTLEYEWTGTLNSQVSSTTISLPEIGTVAGKNELKVNIELGIDVAEADNFNNYAKTSFNKLSLVDFPYIETFENYSNADLENNWAVVNNDFAITWRIDSTQGIESSASSASLKFFQTNSREQLIDDLVSPMIPIGEEDELYLKFSYAYANRLAHLFKDTLQVYISTDKGETFQDILFEKAGQELATHSQDISYGDFYPETPNDWEEVLIDISAYTDAEHIVIKFTGINDNGNNLFIDNVKVYSTTEPSTITEIEAYQLIMYPNPANDELNIVNPDGSDAIGEISIYTILGKELLNINASSPTININVSHLEPGFYLVKTQNKRHSVTQRIYIQ